MLGLLVGVGLDVSPVGSDDDELRAIILQAFDKLALGFRGGIVIGGMCYLRIDYRGEFTARAEPLPLVPYERCCPDSPGGCH